MLTVDKSATFSSLTRVIDIFHSLNYFLETEVTAVEDAFKDLTSRRDIAVLLINQHIADTIRHLLDDYHQLMPALLEIPSKEHPYDPEKDSVLRRVNKLCSQE